MSTITAAKLGLPLSTPLPKRRDWGIGLVGFGGISGAHVDAYRAAGWRIVAVADPSPDARARARLLPGPPSLHETCETLIADPAVEVIVLLTQPNLREPVVAAAAAAGKPVLTEKPLATTLASAERLVALAEAGGIHLAVSQNYRWIEGNFLVHHLIRQGWIGTPFFAGIEIMGTQDRDLDSHPFYGRCTDFLTVQWNSHLADLLRYWTGRDPQRISTITRRMPDQGFVSDMLLASVVDFGAGCTGHILHSQMLRNGLASERCRVDGDQGSVHFGLWGSQIELSSRRLGPDPVIVDTSAVKLLPSQAGAMGDLLMAIEEGREPIVSARRNLATISHILADDRSARSDGQWEVLG